MGGSLSPWLRSYKRQSSVPWEASILVVMEDSEKSAEMEKEIVQNLNWSREIADRLTVLPKGSEDLSIYRIPSQLRKVREDAYSPRVVSIGLLHRDNPNLKAMKVYKRHCVSFILQLTDDFKEKNNYKDIIYELGTSLLEREVLASYAEDLTEIKVDDLVEIMLLDGCFMLALFLRHGQHCLDIPLDPIFNTAWMIPALKHDLALLENQIPFFVLKILYDIIKPHIPHTGEDTPPNSVASLALKFFQPMHQQTLKEGTDTKDFFRPSAGHTIEVGDPEKPSNQQTIKEGTDTEDCKHLLHLLHNFLRPSLGHINEVGGPAKPSNQQTKKEEERKKKENEFKYCASDLYDLGVQFETGSTDGQLSSIEFKDGTIKIPPLVIDDTTFSLFRNLIAFEQCHLKSSHHITSYVIVMKSLIRSKEDIKLLKKKGIITEDVPGGNYYDDFESILDHINLKEFCFGELCDEVNKYSQSWRFDRRKFKAFCTVRFHRYMKSLHEKYFSSPWSIIAFLAAAVVFCITVTQFLRNILGS